MPARTSILLTLVFAAFRAAVGTSPRAIAWTILWGIGLTTGCVTTHRRPCSEGGQPARNTPSLLIGSKHCTQVKDRSGNFVNEGKYYEWYLNDKIALVGEYKDGKKVGRWIEYDEKRNVIGDKYFKDGKEADPP